MSSSAPTHPYPSPPSSSSPPPQTPDFSAYSLFDNHLYLISDSLNHQSIFDSVEFFDLIRVLGMRRKSFKVNIVAVTKVEPAKVVPQADRILIRLVALPKIMKSQCY
ncbi:10 kDa chaperonin 1, chloroplastic-like protein [Drosera capensis]